MKTGLIVAMQSEFDLVSKILDHPKTRTVGHIDFIEGTLGKKDIVLMKSGIGKVNAAAATVEMIKSFSPDTVINTGLAGGIDKSLSVMDIVIGQETAYHDVWCGEGNEYGQIQGLPARYAADNTLLNKARAITSDIRIHSGLIVSGDKFITASDELSAIKEKFPTALAVDMESAAIAQICHLYDRPFLALRIISDTPGIENHYRQYQDFWTQAPEKSLEAVKQILAD